MKRSIVAPAAVVGAFVTARTALAHGGPGGPPPRDPVAVALAWHVDLPMILALALAAGIYLAAVGSVDAAHRHNRWPRRRTAAFIGALVAVGLALLSPVDTLSDDLLTIHMVQHLLLVAVSAPLFAASGIGTLALRAASAETRDSVLLPILRSRLVSVLTFPVVGWVAFAGTMWGSHFSTLYNLALLDDGVHALEHLLYLAAATLFWWPVLSPDPLRWRLHPGAKLLALLAQMPPMSFLAVAIISASAPLYPAYLGRPDAFGIDALTDQRIAGSLMWLTGDLAFLIPGAFLLLAWFRHEEAETRRVDARLDRARSAVSRRES